MSPTDLLASARSSPPGALSRSGVRHAHPLDRGQRLLSGWGRVAATRARVLRPRTAEEVACALADRPAAAGGAIARGAGRSYGDAAQNGGGVVLDATALRGPLRIDAERMMARVGAGHTCAELLARLTPRGLTLPVVPGTRHVTVGGAIAADVHGKNHPRDGSLARQVQSLVLCTPAHGLLQVSAERHPELFRATLGGMGLTGVVVEATLRLTPLRNPCAVADIDRLDTLEQALAAIAAPHTHSHAIAWVDLLAPGAAFGRAVLTRSSEGPVAAAHTPAGAGAAGVRRRPVLTVPRGFPGGVLRPATVRAFNELRWRAAPRRARGRTLSMSAQLFPLDALGAWSRLYGPGGMLQYQFAVPHGHEETVLQVAHRLRARRQPMYLGTLKRLGPGGGGPLSFPIEGVTLAIDLPATAPGLRGALEEADALVAGAGGRVYLAKDVRLRAQTLRAMYPDLARLRELRGRVDPDGTLRSDMARRLELWR